LLLDRQEWSSFVALINVVAVHWLRAHHLFVEVGTHRFVVSFYRRWWSCLLLL
jgi:hypothetical protein